MKNSKNTLTNSPPKLTSGERAQIRNAAPVYDVIRYEEKEEQRRRKDGIAAAYDHIYNNRNMPAGDVLAASLRYQQRGDILDKVAEGIVDKGRLATPEDRRTLSEIIDIGAKCHDKAVALLNSFNRMRARSGLPVGYQPVEVIDG